LTAGGWAGAGQRGQEASGQPIFLVSVGKFQFHRGVIVNTADTRRVRLADIEAVKWVTGCFWDQSVKARRLTAEEIAEIADLEMYQPFPHEPGTWMSCITAGKYITVMAIVASNDSERGGQLVASGRTYTELQVDGLAIGNYAEQQVRLASQTGECSEGCCQANTVLTGSLGDRHVCRHTLRKCKSCDLMPIGKRVELLERLLIHSRCIFKTGDWQVDVERAMAVKEIACELDGAERSAT
jgi:hypothetical protein